VIRRGLRLGLLSQPLTFSPSTILVDTGGTWTGNVTANVGTVTNNGTWGGHVGANASTGTITNNLTWNGNVTSNAGTIINASVATWTGAINANTSVITNNGVWAGNVVSNTGTITNNKTWIGRVSNAGMFNNNAGATVSGVLTNTAGVTIDNGALNGGATVTGGALTGTGFVTTLTMSGGTFAPGNGTPGSSMTVSGSRAFQSGALYLVQLNPATASFATVTGTATLTGGNVLAVFAPGRYVTKSFDILRAAGGFGGTTFSGVSGNVPAGFSESLSYTGTVQLATGFLNIVTARLLGDKDFALPRAGCDHGC
jgi:fibronectin-binding autotransporter adhesin